MTKLILAWHLPDLKECHLFLTKTRETFDQFFIGSPFLKKYGLETIKSLKKEFSNLKFIIDSQIIDHGKINAQISIESGVEGITVMAGAPKQVLHATALSVHSYGREIFINLADSPSLGEISLDATQLHIDGLIIRKPEDPQTHYSFIEKWETIRHNTQLPIYIMSGIAAQGFDDIVSLKPEGIIICKTNTDPIEKEIITLKNLLARK